MIPLLCVNRQWIYCLDTTRACWRQTNAISCLAVMINPHSRSTTFSEARWQRMLNFFFIKTQINGQPIIYWLCYIIISYRCCLLPHAFNYRCLVRFTKRSLYYMYLFFGGYGLFLINKPSKYQIFVYTFIMFARESWQLNAVGLDWFRVQPGFRQSHVCTNPQY